MNNKGFTVMELLASFAIIALILGIGVVSYVFIQKKIEETYYHGLEEGLLLSGSDYFNTNRQERPINSYNEVSLNTLVDSGYSEELVDTKGKRCSSDSKVYIYQENKEYQYETCLVCGNYESSGKYCQNLFPDVINVSAKVILTNESYNPLLSYANVMIAKGSVLTTFKMNNEVSYYTITNISNNEIVRCNASNNQCEQTINDSGSYKVSAYDSNNQRIANERLLSFKIDKEAPNFTINYDKRYVINDGTDKKLVKMSLSDIYDDFQVTSLKYRVLKDEKVIVNYQELGNSPNINNNLASGSYQMEVVAKDKVERETTKKISFDVSYLVKLQFKDDDIEDFEVIKGKNYGYLNNLPTSYKNKLDIEWLYNDDIYNDNTEVSLGSEHTLVLKREKAIITCESNLSYTGNEQVIASCSGGTISNHKKTNAGVYTVNCLGDDDHNSADKVCSIAKVNATCPTLTAYSGNYDGKSHTITVSGGSGGTIEYRTSTTGDWTTTKPTRTNVGTTTVYVRVNGDVNHNTVNCGSKTIEINENCHWGNWYQVGNGYHRATNGGSSSSNAKTECTRQSMGEITSQSVCGSSSGYCYYCKDYKRDWVCD